MSLQATLIEKLNPGRFTAMSGKMAAILGCILDVGYTEPRLVELSLSSDDVLLGRAEGDCGFNEWIGAGADLRRNLDNLVVAADLTPAEAAFFAGRVNAAIHG